MDEITDLLGKLDLVALAEEAGAQLRQKGNGLRGQCPLHGGDNDSAFEVYRDPDDQRERWRCWTGCAAGGDAIDFYQRWKGLPATREGRREAIAELRRRVGEEPQRRPARRGKVQLPAAAPADPGARFGGPSLAWQGRAIEFVRAGAETLWSPAGARAREYLLGQRGLTELTIKRFGLGFNPETYHEPAAQWGLGGDDVWLHAGIVIPCFVAGQLWYVKIRTRSSVQGEKYRGPRKDGRGRCALFGADTLVQRSVVLLAEGEFDTMVLWQELGDRAGMATLGGQATNFDPLVWGPYLLHVRTVLVAYDVDGKSEGGAAKLLALLKRRAWRARLPVEVNDKATKDVTDFHLAGGDLRAWLAGELQAAAAATAATIAGIGQGAETR